eukprot:c11638_g1_i1 orf=146-607(-)
MPEQKSATGEVEPPEQLPKPHRCNDRLEDFVQVDSVSEVFASWRESNYLMLFLKTILQKMFQKLGSYFGGATSQTPERSQLIHSTFLKSNLLLGKKKFWILTNEIDNWPACQVSWPSELARVGNCVRMALWDSSFGLAKLHNFACFQVLQSNL